LSPKARWALTPPFHHSLHPSQKNNGQGGLFSVSLSVASLKKLPCLSQGFPSCGARTFLFNIAIKAIARSSFL
jgi:hypothetical protein